MVEIVIEPWKKIVIHEIIEHKIEDFLKMRIVGVPPGGRAAPITWANGVIFAIVGFPNSGESLKEKIKGVIHYANVSFAIKPEFEDKIDDKEQNITIPLIDVSENETLIQLTDLLKKQSKYTKNET